MDINSLSYNHKHKNIDMQNDPSSPDNPPKQLKDAKNIILRVEGIGDFGDSTKIPIALVRDSSLTYLARGIYMTLMRYRGEPEMDEEWLKCLRREYPVEMFAAFEELLASGYASWRWSEDAERHRIWACHYAPIPTGDRTPLEAQ